jgi:IS5 family transposase
MKTHIGVDARSGLVHTAGVTTGSVHDAKVMDNLIREDDRAVFADKGYVNEKKKQAARTAGVYWAVKEKPKAGRRLSSSQRKRNRRHGAIRTKVEHVFRVLKCQFGYRKVRYRVKERASQEQVILRHALKSGPSFSAPPVSQCGAR